MEQEKAIEVLVVLAKSVKPGLRATEAEHEMIKKAIELLEKKPEVVEPAQ